MEKICFEFREMVSDLCALLSVTEEKCNKDINRITFLSWNLFKKIGVNLIQCEEEIKEINRLSKKLPLYVSSSHRYKHGEEFLKVANQIVSDVLDSSQSFMEYYRDKGYDLENLPKGILPDVLIKKVEVLEGALSRSVKELPIYSKAYIVVETDAINDGGYSSGSKERVLFGIFVLLVSFLIGLVVF